MTTAMTPTFTRVDANRATNVDRSTVVDILSGALFSDPIWSWAFPDMRQRLAQHEEWWNLFVHSALQNHWVWITGDGAAVSVWVPPDVPRFTYEDAVRIEPMLRDLLTAEHAEHVMDLMVLLDDCRPRDRSHYYLSLLGTHPEHRGYGKGQGLMIENLRLIDGENMPAYLEATHPENVPLYERLGFEVRDEFEVAGELHVTTMWREPQY